PRTDKLSAPCRTDKLSAPFRRTNFPRRDTLLRRFGFPCFSFFFGEAPDGWQRHKTEKQKRRSKAPPHSKDQRRHTTAALKAPQSRERKIRIHFPSLRSMSSMASRAASWTFSLVSFVAFFSAGRALFASAPNFASARADWMRTST